MDELRAQRLSPSVFMGGVLNEDVEGSDVPVDVRDDLRRLGVEIPPSVDDLVVALGALRSPAAR